MAIKAPHCISKWSLLAAILLDHHSGILLLKFCHHTFQSSPITGVININILGVHVDTTNPTNVFVECTFHQPGYTCTIDYGTDPSYTNLVYRDTSSTQGRMATITLSQRLRGDTTYYYVVSVESNSRCVRVRGRFQTGEQFLSACVCSIYSN